MYLRGTVCSTMIRVAIRCHCITKVLHCFREKEFPAACRPCVGYLFYRLCMKKCLLIAATAGILFGSCNNKSVGDTPATASGHTADSTFNTSNTIKEAGESIMTAVPTPDVAEEKLLPAKATEVEVTKRVPLTIVVEKLASDVAPIEMSVYSPDDNFLSPKSNAKKYRWRPKKGKAVTKIDNLPYGDFAIALYQDVNDNGKIDKNMIGIPEEPFAFSNDYKPVIKAPSFNDCKFSYSAEQNTITITLQN